VNFLFIDVSVDTEPELELESDLDEHAEAEGPFFCGTSASMLLLFDKCKSGASGVR
jgi:hypothetical protein